MNANKNIWIKRLFSSALHDPLNTLSPNKWDERARPTPTGILVVITINDDYGRQQQQNETRDSTAWRITNKARVWGWRGARERREKGRTLSNGLSVPPFLPLTEEQPASQPSWEAATEIPSLYTISYTPPSPSSSVRARSLGLCNKHESRGWCQPTKCDSSCRLLFNLFFSHSPPPPTKGRIHVEKWEIRELLFGIELEGQ